MADLPGVRIDVNTIPKIDDDMDDQLRQLFWGQLEQSAWFFPVAMDEENLNFLALGWPGCKPIRGYHAGSKSGITIRCHCEIKSFVIDWATGKHHAFPASSVKELRSFKLQWDI